MIKKKGDPEQLYKDLEDYRKVFKEFLEVTGVESLDKVSREIKQQTQKILSEDLMFEDTVKYDLSLEQGRQEDSRVARAEEKVRRLQSSKPNSVGLCQTCTRPTHANGECPGKKRECFTCGLLGHFRGSAACQGKKAAGRKKKIKGQASLVHEISKANYDNSDTEGIGRIVEAVRTTGDTVKNRTANVLMTVLDHGQAAEELRVNFLIDSGVYRTLLTEEQWQQVQAVGGNRKPKLWTCSQSRLTLLREELSQEARLRNKLATTWLFWWRSFQRC